MCLPNFLIIGAAKSGTSSLAYYLSCHPQVHVSQVKEPRFFAFEPGEVPAFRGPGDREGYSDSVTDLEEYKNLFAQGGGKPARGEASAAYLYEPGAARRIRSAIPDAKLIVILRDPPERAFSNYLHLRRDGREQVKDFRTALELEDERIAAGYGFIWRYKALGKYGEQLERYAQLFPSDQIRIYAQSDLSLHRSQVMRDAFSFLGVTCMDESGDAPRLNESGIPRSRALYDFLRGDSLLRRACAKLAPKRAKTILAKRLLQRPELNASTAAYLRDYYSSDQQRLRALLEHGCLKPSVFSPALAASP